MNIIRRLLALVMVTGLIVAIASTVSYRALASAPSSLLSDAVLLLRANSLASDWTAADGWENEGTEGSALDANFVDDATNAFPTKITATHVNPTGNNPGGIRNPFEVEDSDDYENAYGFFVPNSSKFNIPTDGGGFTAVFDITADNISRASKIAWFYEQVDLPSSPSGWVIEHLPTPPDYEGEALENNMITASFDGTNWWASLYKSIIPGRHRIAFRADSSKTGNESWTMFRNGLPIAYGGATGTPDGIESMSELLFGPGYTFHNVAMYDRALSDREMAELNSNLVAPQCAVIQAGDCDSDEDGTKDVVENTAPNNGDANNDGIKDRDQVNVVSGRSTESYSLVTPKTSIVRSSSTLTSNEVEGLNDRQYPFGLQSFTLQVDTQEPQSVEIIYFTAEDVDSIIPQKYNTSTKQFSALSNATLTKTTVNGMAAVRLQYTVQDGGVNDEDGVVNGLIVDPVGLYSKIAAQPTQLSETGSQTQVVSTLAVTTLGGVVLLARRQRRYYTTKS